MRAFAFRLPSVPRIIDFRFGTGLLSFAPDMRQYVMPKSTFNCQQCNLLQP
jgi:hypothetical protein